MRGPSTASVANSCVVASEEELGAADRRAEQVAEHLNGAEMFGGDRIDHLVELFDILFLHRLGDPFRQPGPGRGRSILTLYSFRLKP